MELKLWKDPEKKVVDPLLFSEKAKQFAEAMNEEAGGNLNKSTQLRRFFDEVNRLNDRAKARPNEWDIILPYLHMLIAKAAYAKGRKLVSDGFVSFLKQGINQVKSIEDLRIFTQFFEAFIGFYKSYKP